MNIGIVGISPGSGVSTFASSLAFYLNREKSRRIAVTELYKGSIFDGLGMDKRFLDIPYHTVFQTLAEGKNINHLQNISDGINWILRTPGERSISLPFRKELRLLNNIKGDLKIFDFSGFASSDHRDDTVYRLADGGKIAVLLDLLQEMDSVIALIDPLPSRLLEGSELLAALRISNLPVTYIVNKDNGGVHIKELRTFLRMKDFQRFPILAGEELYMAEYLCKPVLSMPAAGKQLKPAFAKLEKLLGL